jgi:WD40 repeat protein
VNPTKEEYATGGDDAMLRIWSVFSRSTVATIALEMPARCCAYSPDGKYIAVGFGSPRKVSNRQFDGKWVVIDLDDQQVAHEARDSQKWVKDIKYSPNGEMIAMGCYDNKIYVYSVTQGYALNCVIGQHTSFITSLDFSEDNAWLQSNCGGFELFYFEADTGLYIPAAARLRDTAWSTHTCSMTWATQGVWPPHKDGTDITATDCNLFRGDNGTIIASGDNYGRIRLHRYPASSAFSASKLYWTSANPITRLKFACGDSYLISVSADKSIMQWAHKRDREENVAYDVLDRRGKLVEDDDDIVTLFGNNGSLDLLKAEEDDTSHLVGSRPWIAAMVAPSNGGDFNPLETTEYTLRMNHILGLQCHLTRASVRFNNAGDIVYPASKYVCVYNKKNNSQVFYAGHANDISCVTSSRDGLFVASAEKTLRPDIHIWDSSTCLLITKLSPIHRRGLVYMQFSLDGKKLVSVGQDQDHSIALWVSPTGRWSDGQILAWTRSDVNPSTFCSFYEQSSPDGFLLASGGRYHQKFWTLNGKCLNSHYAIYERKTKLGTLLCGTAVGNRFVSGSNVGHIYVWTGRKLDRIIRAHELGVTCIWSFNAGMVTGAKDGIIKLWNLDLEHIRSFTLSEADIPPVLGSVRSLDGFMTPSNGAVLNNIVVCTNSGEVYEVSAKSGSMCLVHEAHYTGQLWGLCVHPTNPDVFATTGDDKTIRVWSISGRRLLRKAIIDCTARTIAFSPDGKKLLIGMGGMDDGKRQRKDGSFLILDAETMKPEFEGRDSRHWLSCVKYSPDGHTFALGSMDHKIYLYNSTSFRLRGSCDRHNGSISDFDFSEDGVYIQSDSVDNEHLYFEAEDGSFFSAGSQLKDIKWNEWSCKFGWPIQGAWPFFDKVEKGLAFEPSAVHRSPHNELLAVGDKGGSVSLYKYPVLSKDVDNFEHTAHINEVAKVRFSCDGRFLISLGKTDRSIIIWKVLPPTKASK